VTLHLEKLWIRDVTLTTGLVDRFSIPQLMRLIVSGRLDPSLFATHTFPLDDTMAAYDTFADAANTHALKVVLQGADSHAAQTRRPAPLSPTEPPRYRPDSDPPRPSRVSRDEPVDQLHNLHGKISVM